MQESLKPVIRVIQIPDAKDDMTESRTIIEINRGQFVIEVKGFGCSEGTFTITGREAGNLHTNLAANNMPEPNAAGEFKIMEYGLALVYVEPTTFAHIILDLFLNT